MISAWDGISYNSSMPLSLKEVEHIAHLARLDITEDEKNRYREQLSAILDHVAQLQKLDTTSIQPTAGVFSADNTLRVDEARPGLPPESLLKTAAEKERNQFKIPPVFE
ncbi:MAG: Asp-tRNA(Asn)/Glu-tRNA(Gln) amidotransferase subunit GatC [Chloroflexota bacterium]